MDSFSVLLETVKALLREHPEAAEIETCTELVARYPAVFKRLGSIATCMNINEALRQAKAA